MEEAKEPATVEEAVATLINDLPVPVRDFVTGSERDRIALQLSQKYNLHLDQADAFQQAYLFLLLGVHTPEDFVQMLTDAGIAEDAVLGLTTDINEQVFKPLRAKERATGNQSSSSSSSAPQITQEVAPIPAQRPEPTPASPAPQEPSLRTMETDMEAAKKDQAPAAHPYVPSAPPNESAVPAVPPVSPPASAPAVPAPPPAPPAVSAPPASPPSPAVPAVPPQPRPPAPPSIPGAPDVTGYPSDPYREPVE